MRDEAQLDFPAIGAVRTRNQGEVFSVAGRAWLDIQPLALDEKLAIQRHLADLDCRASISGCSIVSSHSEH